MYFVETYTKDLNIPYFVERLLTGLVYDNNFRGGGGGTGVVTPSNPPPPTKTFAFTHPLFLDVFAKIP